MLVTMAIFHQVSESMPPKGEKMINQSETYYYWAISVALMLIWFFVGLPASWWVGFLCSLSWTVLTVVAVLFGLVAINKDEKTTKEL